LIEDIVQKGIEITLDKPRRLYFNFAAFRKLAEKYGRALDAIEQLETLVTQLTKKVEAKDASADQSDLVRLAPQFLDLLVDIVLAGLQHEDTGLSREAVEGMLDLDNMIPTIWAIRLATQTHLPKPKGEVVEGPPKA
jgi:hypothetical protein